MTRHAINRSVLLLMAIDTKPHRMVHFALRHRLLLHVAMANGAIHSRPDMRRMVELHVRGGLEAVHALPRDVLASRSVRREFLDLRFIGGDHLMAGHTEVDAWNSRIRALIDPNVALRTLHAVRQMNFMRISDRLDGFRANAKKFANSIVNRGMRRSENFRTWFLRSGRPLRRQRSFQNRQSQSRHSNCNYDAEIMA